MSEELRPKPVRWPIYAVVFLAVALLVGRFVLFDWWLQKEAPSPPSQVNAAQEGEEWSFMQLLSHLRRSELPLSVVTTQEKADLGPMIAVCRADDLRGRAAGMVKVQRHESAASARDTSLEYPEHSFAWGRFCFAGDRNLLDQIAERLR